MTVWLVAAPGGESISIKNVSGSDDQCGFSIDRGISPSNPQWRGHGNSRRAHEERNKRVLRGYPLTGQSCSLPKRRRMVLLGFIN